MDHKLLLLKGIALLLNESHMPDNTDNSAEIVKRIITDAVTPDMVVGRSIDGEICSALKKIASFMAEQPANIKHDIDSIVMDVKMACTSDETIKGLIEAYMSVPNDSDQLKLRVLSLRRSLDQHFEEKDIGDLLLKTSMMYKNDRDKIPSAKSFIAELVSKLEVYTVSREESDPAINFSFGLSDEAKGLELVERIQQQENGTHILQTGWQGLNRALDGGFRPGEQWVIGAQEHNWKTGFLLSLQKHLAIYNDGVAIRDPSKKPALVRFSFEDSAESNLEFLYKSLWENESGQIIGDLPEDPKEILEFVRSRLAARGWEVFIYDVNPSMWTYKDICNEILRLEARGYEVRVLLLDYLLKIPTTGCIQGPHGVDIRNLYERIKAFCAPRKITMITPHQLSPDAKVKAREGTSDFVKEMKGGGYYSGTKQLGQVIDGELFINIEFDARENAYLAIQRGKHRKDQIRQTPMEHRHLVLRFERGGVIPDDIGKEDSTRLKVGGPTLGEMASNASIGMDF